MSLPQEKTGTPELQVLIELCRSQDASPARADLDAGLHSVTARLGATQIRNRRLLRVVPLLALVASSVALGVYYPWSTPKPPIMNYALHGGAVLEGGYLRDVNGSGVRLDFEDGTRFTLASGARARLRSVSASGARLGLESGQASFEVTPNPQHRWEVEVGPFLVLVKGTAFDVAWDPRAEQFRLDLKHGAVVVTGPVSGGQLSLVGGQRLAVDLGKGETKITESLETQPEPSSDASSSQRFSGSSLMPVAATAPTTTPASSRAIASAKRDWASDMARGQWDTILTQAENIGISSVHATASAEDLFSLGNAARYRNRNQLARESLLALQRRFPHSARASDALFLLGRLDESRAAASRALVWYDKYLERSPQGAYAAEALGRKMALIARSLGPEKARAAAEQYLRQYPNGSYARSARAVLEAR